MSKLLSFHGESADEGGSDASSKLGGPFLPDGVLRQKGAIWEGEEMELDHYREERLSGEKRRKQNTTVAVDLTQFQNTTIGQGYQAKHVIRQRTVQEEPKKSMASRKDEKSTTRGDDAQARSRTAATESTRPDQLLQLKALRDFRRELEKII